MANGVRCLRRTDVPPPPDRDNDFLHEAADEIELLRGMLAAVVLRLGYGVDRFALHGKDWVWREESLTLTGKARALLSEFRLRAGNAP